MTTTIPRTIIRLLPLLALVAFSVASGGTVELVVPTYDYNPGRARVTQGTGIANNGNSVGFYNRDTVFGGFIRSKKGHFSRPILFPGAVSTNPSGINISGLVCGSFNVGGGGDHGFFFDGSTYTQFDIPDSNEKAHITGVNGAGDFCGYGSTMDGFNTGFVSIGGVITRFSGPDGLSISPMAINNLGQIVGYYGSPTTAHGFFRAADGTLTYPINYPNADVTKLSGINDAGLIAGWYKKIFTASGMVVQNFNLFTSYDHPDATNFTTIFYGINNSNLITGYYQVDSSGHGDHAFIARFEP